MAVRGTAHEPGTEGSGLHPQTAVEEGVGRWPEGSETRNCTSSLVLVGVQRGLVVGVEPCSDKAF